MKKPSLSTAHIDKLYEICLPLTHTHRIGRRVDQRKAMKPSAFAIPSERAYPIHDPYHAEMALTHLIRTGTKHPDAKRAKKVLAAIHKKWPKVYTCHMDLVAKAKAAHGVMS